MICLELLFASYKCTNCQETISGVRVQCHICQEVELCLQCFAAGAEMGGHKNNHAYQFHVKSWNLNCLNSVTHCFVFRTPEQ
jgi:Zinc finger, ZZ type